MTGNSYADYLQTMKSAAALHGGLDAERDRLLAVRQADLRSAATRRRSTAEHTSALHADLTGLERRVHDLQRRHPSPPSPPRIGQRELPELAEAIVAARRELDELDAADAWIRRSQQQLADDHARVAAAPAPLPPTAAPEAAPLGSSAPGRRAVAWYWWAGGAVVLAAVVAGSAFAIAGGQ